MQKRKDWWVWEAGVLKRFLKNILIVDMFDNLISARHPERNTARIPPTAILLTQNFDFGLRPSLRMTGRCVVEWISRMRQSLFLELSNKFSIFFSLPQSFASQNPAPSQREPKGDHAGSTLRRKITNKKARPLGELPTQGG